MTEIAAEQPDKALVVQFGPAKFKHKCEAIVAVETINDPSFAVAA